MKTASIAAALLCLSIVATPAEAKNYRSWDRASSVGRDALVLVALGLPAIKGDWHGDLAAAGSIGASALIAGGLKEAFPERRPDGSDRKSFPSGHSAVAFAAAASMQNRYGWEIGLPAQVVAIFVGTARVEARKHHWYDVVAGAAIGETAGFVITPRENNAVRVLPWGDTKGGGLAMAFKF